jgi:nitrate/nitrite-specific signal transduction histidine kinase
MTTIEYLWEKFCNLRYKHARYKTTDVNVTHYVNDCMNATVRGKKITLIAASGSRADSWRLADLEDREKVAKELDDSLTKVLRHLI